jgi:hypothetical protein
MSKTASSRQGTETRRRTRHVDVRCTETELAAIMQAADEAGLTGSAYLRTMALRKRRPRITQRPFLDRQALSQVLGLLGRVGGNVNQLARAFNTDATTPEAIELAAIQVDIRTMCEALLKALGVPA